MREEDQVGRVATIRKSLLFAASAFLFLVPAAQSAAQGQRDPLTWQQTEELREHADQPAEKLKLYLRYIEQRTAEIHRLSADPSAPNRNAGIHNLYAEFTEICDELQDNMDAYDEQHADLRKALKLIAEKSGKWPSVLNEPEARTEYDFVRKTALDACQSVHDAAGQMIDEQTKYFAAHKGEKSGGD